MEDGYEHHRNFGGRWALEGEEKGLVAVVAGVEFVGKGDDSGEFVGRENQGPGVDGIGLGVPAEGEGGYNAEILTCTADGPEKVCVLAFGSDNLFAGSEHDVDGEQVICTTSAIRSSIYSCSIYTDS